MIMGQELKLYSYWRSSCSWRVRLALQHKGIKHQLVPVNLLKGEHLEANFLKINPAASLPALAADGRVMTESVAIIEWLEEKFPAKPLLPTDSYMRFRARQLSLMIVAGIQPLQ